MHIANLGRWVFAATLIAFGVLGLVRGELTAPWLPMPEGLPAQPVVIHACAAILVASGAGLLVRRTARAAAGVLLAALGVWMAFRIREVVQAPGSFAAWDGCAELGVPLAAAWLLTATGYTSIRIARALYGLAMIPFGLAHFIYPDETVALIPGYVPAHRAVAYLTGTAFLVAGAAILVGIRARLAAALSVVQIGLFTVLVWGPRWIDGTLDDFQRLELAISIVLTAAGWVVADSYVATRRAVSRTA